MKNQIIAVIYDRSTPFKAAICRHASGAYILGYEAEDIDLTGQYLDGDGHTRYSYCVVDSLEEALSCVDAHESVMEWRA